jgi:ribonuclease HII
MKRLISKMLSARFKDDNVIEIGIDEAGRGSFWGPIMAGALIIPPESTWTEKQKTLLTELRDSKKISPKKRERIADQIKELIPKTAVGIVSAKEINDNGITWANMEAFRRAVLNLSLTKEEQDTSRLVIDGVLQIDKWEGEQEIVVDGDAEYLAIAGASILAKVEHDRWITKFCEDHPECNDRYDLLKSKGYGTANHREGIRNYGAHELHRSLYVQNWLPGSTHKAKTKKKTDKNQCLINFKV